MSDAAFTPDDDRDLNADSEAASKHQVERDLRTEVVYPLLIPAKRRFKDAQGQIREEELTEVTISRPKGKHIKAVSRIKNEEEADLALIGPLTGLTDKDVDELDFADITEIGAIIAGFVRPGRRSGATTSEV